MKFLVNSRKEMEGFDSAMPWIGTIALFVLAAALGYIAAGRF